MKVIDLSTIRDHNGKVPFRAWLMKLFGGGSGWQSELDAQDQVILRFGKALGDDFALIREVKLAGLDTPIPMILVGPPGIYVLYASGVKGTFRARGDAWLNLDQSGNLHMVHPNLPTRTRLYAEAVRKFLTQKGHALSEIEPVLLFSQPEAFVENIKSPIRIVMCDGLESYAGSLRMLNPVFSSMECAELENLLAFPEGRRHVEDVEVEEEEITAQPVIQPSGMDDLEAAVAASTPSEESLRSLFGTSRPETPPFRVEAPEETPVPLPEWATPAPTTEEEALSAPAARISVSSLLMRTHMNSRQITMLGVFALVDILAICGLLFFVLRDLLP